MLRNWIVLGSSVLVACGEPSSSDTTPDSAALPDAPNGGSDGAFDAPPATAFGITAAPGTLRLYPDGTKTLTVHITRPQDVTDVVVSASGLPAGVRVAPQTAGANVSTIELVFETEASAVQSTQPISISITATAVADAARTATAQASIFVAGTPGTFDRSLDNDGQLDLDLVALSISGVPSFERDYSIYMMDDHKLVRLRPNGTLDPSFAPTYETLGKFTVVPVDATTNALITSDLGYHAISLVQASTGQTLPSFGTGVVEPPFNWENLQYAQGQLYVQGDTYGATKGRFSTISLGGAITHLSTSNAHGMDHYTSYAVDPARRITFGGERAQSAALGRLTSTGAVDASFAGGATLGVPSPFIATNRVGPIATNVVTSADGSGHALFTFYSLVTNAPAQGKLIGFTSTGTLAFGPMDVAAPSAQGQLFLAQQPDGKLLVAGDDAGVGFVRRYSAAGELDLAFGTNGTVTLPHVPDRIQLFGEDGRLVLSWNDNTWNAWALHVFRLWL